MEEVVHLGHLIRPVKLEMKKVGTETVQEMKLPTTKKEMRGFLGLEGADRRFVKVFAKISKPFTDLTKNETPTVFTEMFWKLGKLSSSLRRH